MAGLSDSELAFKLQMEEALSASLSFRSSTAPPSPPILHRCGVVTVLNDGLGGPVGDRGGDHGKSPALTPPMVHRCGVVTVLNDDRRSSSGERGDHLGNPPTVGGRNEKPHGKGNIYENVTGIRGGVRITPGISSIHGNSAGRSNTGNPSAVIRPHGSVRPANSTGEGSSKSKFEGNVLYRLYFKGLVNEETGDGKNTALLAGFGVAICDKADNVLFDMKGPLYGTGSSRQAAEIKALMGGLEEAVGLGIKHLAIYCDYYPIYQFLSGRWEPKQNKLSLLMDDVQRIRQWLASSKPVLVMRKDIKFAFKLAREAIVCQISPPPEGTRRVVAARKETCVICLDDIDAEHMFSVDKCLHRYCFSCVKQYVEVRLLRGIIPKCPHDGCKSVLSIDSCGKLLTPKLVDMWKKRIKEDSVPVTEKVYCPYPKCSALMSKTELSRSAESSSVRSSGSGVRRCVECRGLFCINCKVPWHVSLSCTDYKKLHPDPPADDVKLKSLASDNKWRQCIKCNHMIELSQGCYHITCRCGYEFCYRCGAEWNKIEKRCPSSCPLWNENHLMRGDAGFFDDEDEDYEDDQYDEDDYDYDFEDYIAFGPDGPFAYGFIDDEFSIDNLSRWLELQHPEDENTLMVPPSFYHMDDGIFSDEEDWDNQHSGQERPIAQATNPSGSTATVDAPPGYTEERWFYDPDEGYDLRGAPEPSDGTQTVHGRGVDQYIDDWDYDPSVPAIDPFGEYDPWEREYYGDEYDGIDDHFEDSLDLHDFHRR